jgi:hypothetical protein
MIVCNAERIRDVSMWITDHITARIEDNRDGSWEEAPRVERLLVLNMDDYRPEDDEKWDVDEWEARQGYICAPATRLFWTLAYRMARVLAKHGKVTVREWNETVELPVVTVLGIREA